MDLARGFGGPETRILGLARALQRRVERCAVAVARDGPLHQRLRAEGIPCEPVSAPRTDPRLLLQLWRVIRRGGYRVVDAHNIQSIFWGHLAALLAGAPGRITTLHTDYRREYTGVRGWFYPATYALMRPFTRQFIHVTEQLRESAEARGDGDRSTLIPNAVRVPDRPPSRDPSILSEWGWSESDFVIGTIGRLFPVKGQAHMVEALAALRDRPAVKLLLVGDGPSRAELESRVAALGLEDRVRFAGFREDVPRIMRALSCVCVPSEWENLPYVALEAAASARPIVATAVGGVPQLLSDGDTALLVPPADPAALASAIRSLVENPEWAARMAASGYELVRRSFGEEAMVRQTLLVYDRALAR